MKFKFLAAIALAATLFSCDDSTTGVGDFVSDNDKIHAYADTYTVTSRTVMLDSVYSRTRNAYLGRYTDPDFGLYTADFIAQINCPEDFRLPETAQSIEEASLGIFYREFYGDSLAIMRVRVDTLNQVINDTGEDKSLYYTSFDPKKFYDDSKDPIVEKNYAAIDRTLSDSILNDQTKYLSVEADLDKNFCTYLFDKYNENDHANFKDSYTFINNVLKGFYIHVTQGEGSVLYIGEVQLIMKVKYLAERKSTGKVDSVAYTMVPMSSTKEVFMSTHMQGTERLQEMAREKGHTYIKTPAGMCTEVTFPLQEMYEQHKNDTLNSVSLSITKYKKAGENAELSPYKAGIPQELLLIRKSELKDFFEQNKKFDNKTSFIGTYVPETNQFTFTKINRLISHIFAEIKEGKPKDKDWDKVLLVPVITEKDVSQNVIGVSHNMEITSARLFGGEDGEKLNIDLVFTKPTKF